MLAQPQPAPHVRDIIAGLYTKKTGKILPVYDMVFDYPMTSDGQITSKNTTVVATHLLGSGTVGKKTLYYDRIGLELLTTDFPVPLTGTSLYENLELISEHFGIELTQDDVHDSPISANSVYISAKAESFMYNGYGTLSWT